MAIAGFQLTGVAALLVWCSRVLDGRRVGLGEFSRKTGIAGFQMASIAVLTVW
ncbi:hypothetical protein DSM43518_04058 [Mycobacterium marinum]|nr:hypothetical protein CCUG20998_05294 [Mycobacterium marinum]RFZ05449.1 hypothetical protein DSM43518_04058 [Mycobacterium marinum]RFZ08671.1 hypothetical protein VIMS_04128 [Mycobacterium marinum]RFZ21452.1 hypothetical protein DSM43519_03432 [Mycobacterium marinum]RFZ26368.1 hypothetical protein DSM44344_02161 [Mycobacterium marinum]